MTTAALRLDSARTAVGLSFALNGFLFASWIARVPEVRTRLDLSNGQLGLLLLAASVGSVLTLPTTGVLVNRWSAATVVRVGVGASTLGVLVAAVGVAVLALVPVTAAGLFLVGLGIGGWDVAMNVEATVVERRLGRTIMPRFHAGFSLGTVAGAAVGALTVAVGLPLLAHLLLVALLACTVAQATTGRFLADTREVATGSTTDPGRSTTPFAAWLEPRTLLIGLMVFALAVTEGTANDWLALALIDGYDVARWVGVIGFGLFVTSMTVGRLCGPALLDRFGRVPVLWSTMAAAAVGVLLIVYGASAPLVVAGIVLWGVGASLGFPVGISAAADDEAHAAVRVSVVSTIAYTAFLAGPPLLGFLADHVGTLHSLVVVAVLLVPSALVVPASARRPAPTARRRARGWRAGRG